MGEVIEVFFDDDLLDFFPFRVVIGVFELHQQTFLQRLRCYADGLECLQRVQAFFDFFHRGIQIIVDGKFVADGI